MSRDVQNDNTESPPIHLDFSTSYGQIYTTELRVDLPEHVNSESPPTAANLTVNLPPSPQTVSRRQLFTISDVVARNEQPPAYEDLYNEDLPSYNDVLKDSQPSKVKLRDSYR